MPGDADAPGTAGEAGRGDDPRTPLADGATARQDGSVPPSPEFFMPPDAPARPAVVADVGAPPIRAPHPSDEPDDDREPIGRKRLPWRQLLAAALIGILIGAGVPSVFQGLDRAAADARVESLRSTAMAYLAAIAAGESDAATAMVPVEHETPPDAVLRSAQRIELPDVRLTTIDGDLATVEVRYRVDGREVARTLDAERVDGDWRLRTTLAEPFTAYSRDGGGGIDVAGVQLQSSRRVMLYPGSYSTDRTTTPLIVSGGDRFDVDGDPTTQTEIFTTMDLAPGIGDAAEEVGIAHVRACDSGDGCAIEVSPDVSSVDGPWVSSVDATGAVDLVLQLRSRAFAGQMVELRMRATVDEAGALVEWRCSEVSEPDSALEPCRA